MTCREYAESEGLGAWRTLRHWAWRLEWTIRCGETVVYVGAAPVSEPIWPARRHAYDARTRCDDGNAAFVVNTPYVTVWDDETGPLGAIRRELRSSQLSALHLGRGATVL